jgi:hypothetical protein
MHTGKPIEWAGSFFSVFVPIVLLKVGEHEFAPARHINLLTGE